MGEWTDAGRWVWFRDHARIGMDEDGAICLFVWLGDDGDNDEETLAKFPWLTGRDLAVLYGRTATTGALDNPETIDAAADHARENSED